MTSRPAPGPKVPLGVITGLPRNTAPEHLAEIMLASGSGLTAVVIAEATGKAPTSATTLLRSPEWCEDWLLTLVGLEGALRIVVARAEVNRDQRKAREAWERARLVSARVGEARKVVAATRRRALHFVAARPVTAEVAARWALGRLHGPELAELRQAALATAEQVAVKDLPADEEAFFAAAARHGLLTGEADARELLDLEWEVFVDVVADDVRDGDSIDGRLRDPLVAYMWGCALAELHAQVTDLLGIHAPSPSDDFPVLNLNLRSMDRESADHQLRRLRFLAGIRQRHVEQQRLLQDLRHDVHDRVADLKDAAAARAAGQLADRHRPLFEWLLAEMTDLADPETGLMPDDWRRHRNSLLAYLTEQAAGRPGLAATA